MRRMLPGGTAWERQTVECGPGRVQAGIRVWGYKNDWHHVEAYFQLNTIQGGKGGS
jgi:hypothetical protein